MSNQKNKTAFITGASSGIGKEFARIHAEIGGDLVIVARRESNLLELKNELESKYKVNVITIAKDLTKPETPVEIFNELKEKGIIINYLINNAGFGGRGKFHEREWEKDLAMINLNIIALTHLTRLFLPEMVKRNEGKILNVSSTASLMAGPLQAVYFATKAFVTSFSNALSEELHDKNITVSALLPGATATEFAKVSDMDKTSLFEKTFTAREVAQSGYNGMLDGRLNIIAGVTTMQSIMMGMIPFTPKKMLLKQVRQMQEVN